MTPQPQEILAFVVERYDDRQEPVTPDHVAEHFDTPPAGLRSCFRRLVDCELLARTSDGYRPTITGREYLALDVDDGTVVVDPRDDC